METMNEMTSKLENMDASWNEGAANRKGMILELLAGIDRLTSDWLTVHDNGMGSAYVYLTPGVYNDDTFYNGCRQSTDVKKAGVYRVDAPGLDCGWIAINTREGVPRELRFTKSILPSIVSNIESAIKKEIALTEKAVKAESVLSALLNTLANR